MGYLPRVLFFNSFELAQNRELKKEGNQKELFLLFSNYK
jgi:hypothetical protein